MIIKPHVDMTDVEKAISMANELIDKINAIKALVSELNSITANIDLQVGIDEQTE